MRSFKGCSYMSTVTKGPSLFISIVWSSGHHSLKPEQCHFPAAAVAAVADVTNTTVGFFALFCSRSTHVRNHTCKPWQAWDIPVNSWYWGKLQV